MMKKLLLITLLFGVLAWPISRGYSRRKQPNGCRGAEGRQADHLFVDGFRQRRTAAARFQERLSVSAGRIQRSQYHRDVQSLRRRVGVGFRHGGFHVEFGHGSADPTRQQRQRVELTLRRKSPACRSGRFGRTKLTARRFEPVSIAYNKRLACRPMRCRRVTPISFA